MRFIDKMLKRASPPLIALSALAILAFINVIDFKAAANVKMLTLHWIPAAFAAWYGGWECGLAVVAACLASSTFQQAVDLAGNWTTEFLALDSMIRGLSLSFLVFLVERLRTAHTREADALERSRDAALNLRASAVLLLSREIGGALAAAETTLTAADRESDAGARVRLRGAMRRILAMAEEAVRRFIFEANSESRRAPSKLVRTPPAAVVEQAVEMFRPLIEDLDIALAIATPDGPEVWADRAALALIMSHLLANAVLRSGRGGKVSVTVSPEPEKGPRFSVIDSGPAIDEKTAKRLRGEGPPPAAGESDLRFATVRELLRLHDSFLDVHAAPNGGAVFSFALTAVSSAPKDGLDETAALSAKSVETSA